MIKTRTKIFVSNKGVLLEDKLNGELERLESEGYYIRDIHTDISYSGSTGYQAIGTIVYEEYIEDDLDYNFTINSFDPGELIAVDTGAEG